MARATGKDHAQINLDIWGNEDWLDLTPSAQHLYFVLWTSPQLSYCGTGDWHLGKIAAKAHGWTTAAVDAAAVELSRELFLIIDTETEEFILRSWIKHDGLWRTPNMSVAMANARADLASRTLRAVIVHEVAKLKKNNPDSNSWQRDAVANLLTQKAIDPATLPPYPGSNPGSNPPPNPTFNPTAKGYAQLSVNPPSNPGPTPAPSPTPTSLTPIGGSVSTEGHQSTTNQPPPRYCPNHMPDGTTRKCVPCQHTREAFEEWEASQRDDELERRRLAKATAAQAELDCNLCENSWLLDADGTPVEPAVKCRHPEARHA
jgi:hypothetical protein